MPNHETIRRQKVLKVFGNVLYNPNLWVLNRRSASGAFAVGLFMCFLPLPSQMIFAAAAAIVLGVNLPLAIALVWISNPITMPIMFYLAYRVGTWVMQTPRQEFEFILSWEYLLEQMSSVGPPFLLGCAICAVLFSMFGYFGIRAVWRYSVARSWRKRSRK